MAHDILFSTNFHIFFIANANIFKGDKVKEGKLIQQTTYEEYKMEPSDIQVNYKVIPLI